MSVKQLDDKTLEEEIKGPKPVLVDFYADWCGPCRAIAPIFDELSKDYEDKITFGRLDVDKNSRSPAKYGIRSIPYLLYFKDGEEKDNHIGSLTKSELKAKIEEWLGW